MPIKRFIYSEIFFVVIVIALVISLNLVIYAYGYFSQDEEYTFLGSVGIFNDIATYLSEMEQGRAGDWLVTNKYTTEEQTPAFIFIFYILLGKVAKLLGISSLVALFAARLVLGLALLVSVYFFIKRFIANVFWRKVAFLLVGFSSGLGWLAVAVFLNSQSIDLWLEQAVPVQRFLCAPHILFALMLFLGCIIWLLNFLNCRKTVYLVLIGLSLLILNLILPYHSVVLYLVIALYLVFLRLRRKLSWRPAVDITLAVFLSLPSFIYMIYLGYSHPIWSSMQAQNWLDSPSVIYLVSGFGLLLILAVIAVIHLWKQRIWASRPWLVILAVWLLAAIILAYIPVRPQLRFLEASLYIPMAILAALGLQQIFKARSRPQIIRYIMLFLCLTFFSNLLVLKGNIDYLSRKPMPIYLKKSDARALTWLKENSPAEAIVLSSFATGQIIPIFTDRFAYIGHWAETLNLNEKQDLVELFYNNQMTVNQAKQFLLINDINYVLYFNIEKSLEYQDPEIYPFLLEVHKEQGVKVYEVRVSAG